MRITGWFVRPGFRLQLFVLLVLLESGCVSPIKGLYPPQADQSQKTIYVLRRGLHTGVIIRTLDVPPGVWPEHDRFARAQYLEVGWGDSAGYRYPWTSGSVVQALFDSKESTLLIHPFSGPVVDEYAEAARKIIAVTLSDAGFARLCGWIHDTYALDPIDRPLPLPGGYSHESFFRATGHYSLVNNCNNWTASALRAAGCPISPRWCVLPGIVTRETQRFGHVIWSGGSSGG